MVVIKGLEFRLIATLKHSCGSSNVHHLILSVSNKEYIWDVDNQQGIKKNSEPKEE